MQRSKKGRKSMTKVVSALTARTQLGQIMKRASSNNERFVVDRRGEPSVIIMGVQDYIQHMAPAPEWLEAVWAESKRNATDQLTAREIDSEISQVRHPRGRKSSKRKAE